MARESGLGRADLDRPIWRVAVLPPSRPFPPQPDRVIRARCTHMQVALAFRLYPPGSASRVTVPAITIQYTVTLMPGTARASAFVHHPYYDGHFRSPGRTSRSLRRCTACEWIMQNHIFLFLSLNVVRYVTINNGHYVYIYVRILM